MRSGQNTNIHVFYLFLHQILTVLDDLKVQSSLPSMCRVTTQIPMGKTTGNPYPQGTGFARVTKMLPVPVPITRVGYPYPWCSLAVTRNLSSSTNSARTTVVLDKRSDFRPSVVSLDKLESLVLTEVSCEYVVVLAA